MKILLELKSFKVLNPMQLSMRVTGHHSMYGGKPCAFHVVTLLIQFLSIYSM